MKKIEAKEILDSRKDKSIKISITYEEQVHASAPSGKSKGKYEAKSYAKDISGDINIINKSSDKIIKLGIEKFSDLAKLEKLMRGKIGANSLFALEAAILKYLARREKKELFEILGKPKFPRLVGNAIGGGVHSHNKTRPDFQEFLFIPDAKISLGIEANERAYWDCHKILTNLKRVDGKNDENAWQTSLDNEAVLEVMNDVKENVHDELGVKINIGVDVAGSSFYNKFYAYKNKEKIRTKEEQVEYVNQLARKYNLFYIEDPIQEEDFDGFSKLTKKSMIVGDDLTVTNLERLKRAIKLKSISGIIIKPNQNGSLLETKKVVDLARKNEIKTIISHRSGETMDTTISDLAVAWNCDYIKSGIMGKERKAKLERLREIESKI